MEDYKNIIFTYRNYKITIYVINESKKLFEKFTEWAKEHTTDNVLPDYEAFMALLAECVDYLEQEKSATAPFIEGANAMLGFLVPTGMLDNISLNNFEAKQPDFQIDIEKMK